jgi:hypothetical protein
MGEVPTGMSLDRIDNDSGYSPENCRWATPVQQSNNRSCTVRFEFKGGLATVDDLSRISGISKCSIRRRLELGWTAEMAVSKPVKIYAKRKQITQ